MILTQAPGKLILAGEISVLEQNNSCIVMALDAFLSILLEPCNRITVHAPDIGINQTFIQYDNKHCPIDNYDERLRFVRASIHTALRYLHEQNTALSFFRLTIKSEISTIKLEDGTLVKPGLGSSAALVVATITAILRFHGYDTDNVAVKKLIFKLACLAHYNGQGTLGSGADIAAATFEDTLHYRRFNKQWFLQSITQSQTISSIITQEWPDLYIEPLLLPHSMNVCIGFVGKSSSTSHIIQKLAYYKNRESDTYIQICSNINNIVLTLIMAIKSNDEQRIISLIKQNRLLLKQLSETSGCSLETDTLAKLVKQAEAYNASAKFSGAGGGDCGIAICFDDHTAQYIRKAWQLHGIYTIPYKPLRSNSRSKNTITSLFQS